jgi:NADPH-dependent 2,4-dienoyl-CoA reductase/sulfur reductase-like enzyme
VVPNVELAEAAGITIANGIRVDQQMRTSAPDILAIGDAASYRHWFTGGDEETRGKCERAAQIVSAQPGPATLVPTI